MGADAQRLPKSGVIGSGDYFVRDGDCLSSIACDHGHRWETIWDDPVNHSLKRIRLDPNVLLEGDRLSVMPIRSRQVSRATDQRHRFVYRMGPAKLRLRLIEERPAAEPSRRQAPEPAYRGDAVVIEDAQVEPQALEDRGIAGAPFILEVDGHPFAGETDLEGLLEVQIPPDAEYGSLTIFPGP